jgi:hypothetical protein
MNREGRGLGGTLAPTPSPSPDFKGGGLRAVSRLAERPPPPPSRRFPLAALSPTSGEERRTGGAVPLPEQFVDLHQAAGGPKADSHVELPGS